jgi:hypothetical protein
MFLDFLFGRKTVTEQPLTIVVTDPPPKAAGPDVSRLQAVVDDALDLIAAALPIGRGHYAAKLVRGLLDLVFAQIAGPLAARLAAKGIKVGAMLLAVLLVAAAASAGHPESWAWAAGDAGRYAWGAAGEDGHPPTLAPVVMPFAADLACPCGPACDCEACECTDAAPVPPLAAPVWRRDPDGSADLGLWRGDAFLGRWFAANRTYQPWVGVRYGPPVPDAGRRAADPPDGPAAAGVRAGARPVPARAVPRVLRRRLPQRPLRALGGPPVGGIATFPVPRSRHDQADRGLRGVVLPARPPAGPAAAGRRRRPRLERHLRQPGHLRRQRPPGGRPADVRPARAGGRRGADRRPLLRLDALPDRPGRETRGRGEAGQLTLPRPARRRRRAGLTPGGRRHAPRPAAARLRAGLGAVLRPPRRPSALRRRRRSPCSWPPRSLLGGLFGFEELWAQLAARRFRCDCPECGEPVELRLRARGAARPAADEGEDEDEDDWWKRGPRPEV